MRRRKSKKNRLYLRFRRPDGNQAPYCPALFDSKSRIRSFWCLVKGVEEHHPEGTYYRRISRATLRRQDPISLGVDANELVSPILLASGPH